MTRYQHIIAASLTACCILLPTAPAHSAGVGAGTLIQNSASATYTSGSGTTTIQSNTVTVTVDQLLDVAVAELDSSPVAASSNSAVLTYSITNTGNGSDAFILTADPNVSGNAFNAVVQSIVFDTNGDGKYDAGDQVIAQGAATPQIAANGSSKVFVIVSLPPGATDAQSSQVKLTATSIIGSGSPGTVFAKKGVTGVDAIVGLSHGTQSALDSVTASLATVSLVKSAVIADQFGSSNPLPGAVVTYTIVAHVSGSGTAGSVHVVDVIPTGTTYQAGTLALNGTSLTDPADSDPGTASSTGIDVALGNVAGGSSDKSISFKVKIN